MVSKLWALVKWIGGEDDKKYSTGIPIEWIQGFDIEEFRSDKFDPELSYVIEWRSKGKKPPGGWPVYDGYVIEVSNRNSVLEKKIKMLDGLKSPTKIATDSDEQEPDPVSGQQDTTKSTIQGTAETQSLTSNSSACDGKAASKNVSKQGTKHTIHTDQVASGSGLQNQAGKIRDKHWKTKRQESQHNTESEDEISDGDDKMSGVEPLKKNKSRTKLYKSDSGRQANVGLERTLRGIQDELKRLRKKKRSRNMESDTSDSSEDEMREIGPRGSGIFIREEQWAVAKTARTYTAMGISLLVSLFPMDVLLRSNLRGGKSKIGAGNENRRPPLDKKIIDALYYTVRRNFKSTFSNVGLGMAINNKLTHLRTEQKKNRPIPDGQ